jgi:hypothetical protein
MLAAAAGWRGRIRSLASWLVLACVGGACVPTVAAPPGFDEGVLDLPGGGSLHGRLLSAPAAAEGDRGTLLWKSPAFVEPFEFRLDEIAGLRLTAPRSPAPPVVFRCHLRGGDAIDGDIDSIDLEQVVIVTPGGERVRIDATAIDSITRLEANLAGGFVGPSGLTGWEQSPASSWQEEGGRIRAHLRGAAVVRDLGSPPRACYDVVVAWKRMPEFRIGIGNAGKAGDAAYRLEYLTIDGKPAAALVRQEKGNARIAIVDVGQPANRLHVRLFVDQRAGRLAGVSIDGGKPVFADVTLPPAAGAAASGRFCLALDGGDVSLDSLRVSAWTTPEPLVEERIAAAVTGRDGRAVEGTVTSFDKASGELVMEGGQKLELADVDAIAFRPAAAGAEGPPAAVTGGLRVMRRAGAMLSGALVSIDEQGLRLRCPGIEEPVPVPLDDVMSFVPTLPAAAPRPLPGRVGSLKTEGVAMRGCLVDGSGSGNGVAWMPVGSLNASALVNPDNAAPSAVLEYVPRPPRPPKPEAVEDGSQVEVGGIGGVVNQDGDGQFVVSMLSDEGAAARDGRLQPGDRVLAIKPLAAGGFVPTKGLDVTTVMNLMRGRVGTPVVLRVDSGAGREAREIDLTRGLIYVGDRSVLDEALATHARLAVRGGVEADVRPDFPSVLILGSGDVVPARIDAVDARGVRLLTPVADAGGEGLVVAASLVKAIEIDPAVESQLVDRVRADRMLMLPRSQRASPPTHLVRLRDGDYLRGRLVRLDDKTLVLEVRGEVKKLHRGAVARIIWLHPEEDEPQGREPEADGEQPAAPAGLLVQGVARGRRMTLVAERVEGSKLRGTSPAFGSGQIDLDQIDWLLIGGAIDGEADELPFGQWKLRPAPEPRALRDDAQQPAPTG